MPITDSNTKEELQEEFENIDDYIKNEDRGYLKRVVIPWTISTSLHILVLLTLLFVVVQVTSEPDKESPVFRPAKIDIPVEIKKEKPIVALDDNKVVLTIDDKEPIMEPISQLEETLNEKVQSDDNAESEGKHGREEAVSDIENGSMSNLNVMGLNSGASGMFGSRTEWGKRRITGKLGPHGRPTVSSISNGLRWLKKHQSANGEWDAINYYNNCQDGDKCEPGKDVAGDENVAMTGYAILCFLGFGYDHQSPSQFNKTVEKGIKHLISVQTPDGLLGQRNYEHAVASMALFEAYAMSQDQELKEPCKKALKVLLDRQLSNGEYDVEGWDYIASNPERTDFSVSGWCIMAIKSAYGAGFDVGNSLIGFKTFTEKVWKLANPKHNDIDQYKPSIFPYVYNGKKNKVEKDHLSFVGGVVAIFSGHVTGDVMLESLIVDVKNRWLNNKKYRNNLYALYYASMLAFQAKSTWDEWYNEFLPYLNSTQIQAENSCKDGTWNFEKQEFHGSETSQVLKHCYALLSLEVAFRYKRIMEGKIR